MNLSWAPMLVGVLCLGLGSGCDDNNGEQGPRGHAADTDPTPAALTRGDDTPGIRIEVLDLAGGSGANGNFRVGDALRVHFTIKKDDDSDWDITEMSRGRILVSGPTFNYNRVLPEASDLASASVQRDDGSYRYTFATAIPATYLAPENDSDSFGVLDGELTGQSLLDGTYTVALYTRWDYSVDGADTSEAGNAEANFLFGGATTLTPREVVTQANCNRCHSDLQAHGGMRKDVTLCLLCHTSGAEDDNEDGMTPGVSVDFRVLIHKIHNGEHLPSVLGVATNADGSRNYAATPMPYQVAGHSLADFSNVAFPVFPNLNLPMPRDVGYSALDSDEKGLEDTIREGVTNCDVCHGDPDGDGPLAAPAQGGLAYSQPSRRACGSCHDDIDWTLPYTANLLTMEAQADDSTCLECHSATSGESLATVDVHVHPLLDSNVNPGLYFSITSVEEATSGDDSGTIDAGEAVHVTLTVRDDADADVVTTDFSNPSVVLSGPTSNSNLLLSTSIPVEALTGAQPYEFNLPETVYYEYVGDSDGTTNSEVFTTARTPHWSALGAPTTVYTRAVPAGGTTLSAAAAAYQNFVDTDDGSSFLADDVIVVDDANPALEEYLRVQWVDDDRLWFASPAQSGYQSALRVAHASGASVQLADLTELTEGDDYNLNPTTGEISETPELGDVALVVTYTTDFLMPSTYGNSLNDSADLGEEAGEWTGKSLVDGTYGLDIWSTRNLSVDVSGTVTTYRGTSSPEHADFLVGAASTLEPYDLIESAASCYSCHEDLWFHGGGRRGFETCLACHGTAGAEDRPQYRAWGAPATTGVQITFRELIHKIHMGEELTNASTYTVVGFGSGSPPGNFGTSTYEEVAFPVMPGGVMQCSTCHGSSASWKAPAERDHPTEQDAPARVWSLVCASCHDSDAAAAHMDSQTFGGQESCTVCHDAGREWDVERMHRAY